MDAGKLIAAEYAVAVGIVSWSAIKGDSKGIHYWPWPPTVIMTSTAFGILGLFSTVQPDLAGILGAGFLLAQLIRAMGKGSFFDLSGIPNSGSFWKYADTALGGNSYYRVLTF